MDLESLEPLQRLVKALSRLPGVGRRSAERMALHLARDPRGLLTEVGAALRDVRDQIAPCSTCGVLTAVSQDPCRFCTGPGRDAGVLCVVTDTGSAYRIENSGAYHGRYHVFGGVPSPQRGQGL